MTTPEPTGVVYATVTQRGTTFRVQIKHDLGGPPEDVGDHYCERSHAKDAIRHNGWTYVPSWYHARKHATQALRAAQERGALAMHVEQMRGHVTHWEIEYQAALDAVARTEGYLARARVQLAELEARQADLH